MTKNSIHDVETISPQQAYKEGFEVGSSGMDDSFALYGYLNCPHLRSHWEKGWKDGQKKHGKLGSEIFVILGIAVVTAIGIGYWFNSYIEENDSPQTLSAESELIPPTPISSTTVDVSSSMEDEQTQNYSPDTSSILSTLLKKNEQKFLAETKNLKTKESTQNTSTKVTSQNAGTSVTSQNVPSDNNTTLVRALFAEKITHREPTGQLFNFTSYVPKLFFFTEFRDFIGNVITHQWFHGNELVSSHQFPEIKGNHWRVFSDQKIDPDQLGKWTVKVYDHRNNLLHETFLIVESNDH